LHFWPEVCILPAVGCPKKAAGHDQTLALGGRDQVGKGDWTAKIRAAVGQLDLSVGDLKGNVSKLLGAIRRAEQEHFDLIVFPELCVTGFPPCDLLLRPDFVEAQLVAFQQVVRETPEVTAVVGYAKRENGRLFNCAAVIRRGTVVASQEAIVLKQADGFDRRRYFAPGRASRPFRIKGVNVAILVGEDVTEAKTCAEMAAVKAEMLIVPMASSFYIGRPAERLAALCNAARAAGADLITANLVGGQEELVFDGASLAIDARGNLVWEAPQFKEGLFEVEPVAPARVRSAPDDVEQLHEALVLAIRDYASKSGFVKAVIGLSGGVDSSLVATLATTALGPKNVLGLLMPSHITSAASVQDALQLASNLGIETKLVPIKPIFDAYIASLREHFSGRAPDVAEENIQARIRGDILMAFSNKFGYLVLSTGNRSEALAGYATLYGDMAGGFSPISDVPKTLVYKLAHYINARADRNVIPHSVLTKEPSAELAVGQKDEDALGPYETLDQVFHEYVDKGLPPQKVAQQGSSLDAVRRAIRMIYSSQHKRYQAPPGPRVFSREIPSQRRLPILNQFEIWSNYIAEHRR